VQVTRITIFGSLVNINIIKFCDQNIMFMFSTSIQTCKCDKIRIYIILSHLWVNSYCWNAHRQKVFSSICLLSEKASKKNSKKLHFSYQTNNLMQNNASIHRPKKLTLLSLMGREWYEYCIDYCTKIICKKKAKFKIFSFHIYGFETNTSAIPSTSAYSFLLQCWRVGILEKHRDQSHDISRPDDYQI